MMFIETLKPRGAIARLSLHCIAVEPSKITLPFKEGTDLIINCAMYGSNRILFAIWVRVMYF